MDRKFDMLKTMITDLSTQNAEPETMTRYLRFQCLILLITLLLLSSCAGRYFREVSQPLTPPGYLALSAWPYNEYWTGIVFNGARIGFSHFKLSPSKDEDGSFDIHAEAYLHIRFLMFDKKINLKSYDQVAHDLNLKRFVYEYELDGNKLMLRGQRMNGELEIEIHTRGQSFRQIITLEDKIFPTAAIGLYPVMHGLAVGHKYTYSVYDGETKSVSTVKQNVLAYEESDLFPGRAFKVRTRLHGHDVTTWIDSKGRPVLEMSLGGIIISALESKTIAQRYLTQAAINKDETLLDFSLIRVNIPINNPTQVTTMEVVISGLNAGFSLPVDNRQKCEPWGEKFFCQIYVSNLTADNGSPLRSPANSESIERYLQPSYTILSQNPLIKQTAAKIVKDAGGMLRRIQLLVDWLQENIEQEPVDVFTALDVFEGRKAECQGHSYLYTAFARAIGIPTRVINGIVYSREHQGFVYHTWAESLVGEHWMAVDPTLGQIPADATHIKLIEGELISELLPLVDLVGHMGVRIIAVDNQ